MKNLDLINKRDDVTEYKCDETTNLRFFIINYDANTTFFVTVENNPDYDHISAITTRQFGIDGEYCPSHGQMVILRNIFFNDDEYALEFHPDLENYVNLHENLLHLWRPKTKSTFPLPNLEDFQTHNILFDSEYNNEGHILHVVSEVTDIFRHVSVSLKNESKMLPTWDDMCFVKSEAFGDYESAFQIDYPNFDDGTLHIWQPRNAIIQLPLTNFPESSRKKINNCKLKGFLSGK